MLVFDDGLPFLRPINLLLESRRKKNSSEDSGVDMGSPGAQLICSIHEEDWKGLVKKLDIRKPAIVL
jgi:hypothetical protein